MLAHPLPFRQYADQGGPPQGQYGPPRGGPSRQGSVPRDYGGYDDGYRNDGFDDRNYRYGPPPPQQQQYPPRGGGPPQTRRPPPNGPPRDDMYDRRGGPMPH